jgi:glycerophosphoryl diester phosphodiesterase
MTAPNLSWPYPKFIAHRGAGHAAPENTLAAMRVGARQGHTMVEYDVKLSLDGVPVLLHDDTVDRSSNGKGRACDLTYRELAKLDFGSWHSREYAGEPIPTLYAIAAFTQANNLYSNIEIKPSAGTDADTGRRIAQFAAQLWSNADVLPLISSFSEPALQAALRAAPQLPRALLLGETVPKDWPKRLQRLRCLALNVRETAVTAALVREVHAKGYKIAPWTVHEPARAQELLEWGCDALFTNDIQPARPDF